MSFIRPDDAAPLMPNSLPLNQALSIAQSVLAKGRESGCKPLTVAVLDAGGHLVALLRDDGTSNLRPQIAIGKANGALALGVSSRKIAAMAQERPQFVNALSNLTAEGLLPAAGGVLIRSANGDVIGAVGVTGDTSDQDEACALHAIASVGLHASE
jgi:uncharacterized protein GlcG (DUF336 family)